MLNGVNQNGTNYKLPSVNKNAYCDLSYYLFMLKYINTFSVWLYNTLYDQFRYMKVTLSLFRSFKGTLYVLNGE